MLFQYLTLILIQYENLISEIDTDLILNCDIETIQKSDIRIFLQFPTLGSDIDSIPTQHIFLIL